MSVHIKHLVIKISHHIYQASTRHRQQTIDKTVGISEQTGTNQICLGPCWTSCMVPSMYNMLFQLSTFTSDLIIRREKYCLHYHTINKRDFNMNDSERYEIWIVIWKMKLFGMHVSQTLGSIYIVCYAYHTNLT